MYKLKCGEVFNHNDDVDCTLAALDIFHMFDIPFSFMNLIHIAFRIFAAGWGYLGNMLGFASMLLLSVFHIDFTETLLILPYAIVSLLIPFYSYKIAKLLFNEYVAIISAALIAVMPGLAAFSRTNATQIINYVLFLMTIYYFLVYFSSKGKKARYLAPACLGLFISNDPAFLPVLLALPLISFNYISGLCKTFLKKAFGSIRPFFRPHIFFTTLIFSSPLIIINAYLFLAGKAGQGLVSHIMVKLTHGGFYYEIFWYTIPYAGMLIFVLILVSILSSYKLFKKGKDNKTGMGSRILMYLSIPYALPWLFIMKPAPWHVGLYIYFIIPLVILGVSLIHGYLKRRNLSAISYLLFIAMFIVTFFTAFISINNYNTPSFKNLYPALMGSNGYYYGELLGFNRGFKTAGYFVRENTAPNELFFSDCPSRVMRYYIGRNPGKYTYITSYEGTDQIRRYFNEVSDNVSVVIIEDRRMDFYMNPVSNPNTDIDAFMKLLPEKGFFYSAKVVEGNETRLHIFTRKNTEFKVLDTRIYDPLFDKKYGNWEDLYLVDYYRLE